MAKRLKIKGAVSFDIAINEEIVRKNKIFVVHCLDFEVTSQGKSVEEAIANIKEAVSLYLEECPEEMPKVTPRFKEAIMPPIAARIFL